MAQQRLLWHEGQCAVVDGWLCSSLSRSWREGLIRPGLGASALRGLGTCAPGGILARCEDLWGWLLVCVWRGSCGGGQCGGLVRRWSLIWPRQLDGGLANA